jgi:hypothetical protein
MSGKRAPVYTSRSRRDGAQPPALLLGYAGVTPVRLREGVQTLAQIMIDGSDYQTSARDAAGLKTGRSEQV